MIDKTLNIPLYIQIYNDIKREISENRYVTGEFLPSERELSEKYEVERATVRRALTLLVNDNLLVKVPGAGSKIKSIPATPSSPATVGPVSEARAPAGGDARIIAFVLPDGPDDCDRITEPFISSVFYHLENECRRSVYSLTYIRAARDEDVCAGLIQRGVAGAVWVSRIDEKILEMAVELGIPSVLVSNTFSGFSSIQCDNTEGSAQAVGYLASLGHTDIAYIGGTDGYLNARERYDGFTRAMAANGLAVLPEATREGDWTFKSGYRLAQEILADLPQITAIYAANDAMALGAISCLRDSGIPVPGRVSVMGFDNIDHAHYCAPSLTTIGVDVPAFTYRLSRLMFEGIRAKSPSPIRILMPTALIVRESTARPRR